MAKSTRSKVKRAFRSKKRESGIYAVTEAARLQRLNLKLHQTMERDQDGDVEVNATEGFTEDPALETSTAENQTADGGLTQSPSYDDPHPTSIFCLDSMRVDSVPQPKRISTHGPRGSRREEWRKSKGMTPRPASRGMNRQGGVAGRRKAGRSKRRR